jgi:hypothetical protein
MLKTQLAGAQEGNPCSMNNFPLFVLEPGERQTAHFAHCISTFHIMCDIHKVHCERCGESLACSLSLSLSLQRAAVLRWKIHIASERAANKEQEREIGNSICMKGKVN